MLDGLVSGALGQLGGGAGQQAASWVGTGENMPVSGDQISQALGDDAIAGLAQKLGIDQGQVSSGLAGLLPQVVDKLTPNGAIEQALSGLLKGLGR